MIEGTPLFRRGQRFQAALVNPLFHTQGPEGIPHSYGVLAQQSADEDGLWELLRQFQELLAEKAVIKIFRQAEKLPGDDTPQRSVFFFSPFHFREKAAACQGSSASVF